MSLYSGRIIAFFKFNLYLVLVLFICIYYLLKHFTILTDEMSVPIILKIDLYFTQ